MKLRIQGNSIRLRLNIKDVERFAKDQKVIETVDFNNNDGSVLEYSLEETAEPHFSAAFMEGRLTVSVPSDAARKWTGTDQIGIEGVDGKLSLLVEKDFVCLTPKRNEDESDNYPHPDAKSNDSKSRTAFMEIAEVLTANKVRKVRVKGIALTSEHGSWGMLFEPLVAAVAVAYSPSTIWILLLVIGGFMMRQPVKILLTNLLAKRNLPQNAVALQFSLIYGAVLLIGLIGSVLTIHRSALLPFAIAAPFALFQIRADAKGKGRDLLPELAGSLAISSSAAVIALDAGWTPAAAFSLWAVLVARSVTSVAYVRNRLRLEKGKAHTFYGVVAVHFAAAVLIAGLAEWGLASPLTLAVFVLLLIRAAAGLSKYRQPLKAMKIGIWEVVYGLLTVTSIIAGYYLGF